MKLQKICGKLCTDSAILPEEMVPLQCAARPLLLLINRILSLLLLHHLDHVFELLKCYLIVPIFICIPAECG